MKQIAIMGHGIVGSGVAEVLTRHPQSIADRAGEELNIKYILDIRDFLDSPLANRFTRDFEQIVNDPEICVVAEVMGGLEPAFPYVKRCLSAGKSVVTSNKELVATHGQELLELAREHNVNFLFEASVGGGIPIIRPLSQCMAANEIDEIQGILNGTTNFILTKMFGEQMPFEQALALAQELGYAEKDPTADVDGHDSCRKVCILASLTFGRHVYPGQVYTEGIRDITLNDVEYAGAAGCVIKLIGRVSRLPDDRVSAAVYPALVARGSQLSTVDDVYNAILVRGDATGDVVFYGRGAGKLPTASAVVADIIDCVKHLAARKYLYWADGQDHYVADHLDDVTRLFVRAKLHEERSKISVRHTFEAVSAGSKNVPNAASAPYTLLSRAGQPDDEVAFLTSTATERELRQALDSLDDLITPISILHVVE